MNDDFYRKVEIFQLMHKLKLCHFVVYDGGSGHGSPSLLVLPDGVTVLDMVTGNIGE